MANPIIKIVEGLSPLKTGLNYFGSSELGSITSALSRGADSYPHDEEGLLQILHFRNQIAKGAKQRSGWFGGRIYNKFSGEDPDYIPISGTHLRQTLGVVNIEVPNLIVSSGKYLLRVDIAKEAVTILLKNRDLPQSTTE